MTIVLRTEGGVTMPEITSKEDAKLFLEGGSLRDAIIAQLRYPLEDVGEEYNSKSISEVMGVIDSLVAEVFGLYPGCSFAKVLASDSLVCSAMVADESNKKLLYVYAYFMGYCIPRSDVWLSYMQKFRR